MDRKEIKGEEYKKVEARWQEHFIMMEVLNRAVLEVAAEVDETNVMKDSIDVTEEITREEIKSALGDMKSGKTPGKDSTTADLLKADTVNTLHGLFNSVWEEESVLESWSRGLVIKLPKKGDFTSCGIILLYPL